MKESSDRKSSRIFPLTEGINAYLNLQKTYDTISRTVSEKLAQWKLSVPKYGVMIHLYDHESLPLTEISKLIFRGNSNLTALIDRMERDGLVQRVNHGTDRRIKEIRLTEKGRGLAPKVIGEYRSFLHQMMNCFTPDEQKTLSNLLSRLNDRLKRE